jgi:hypothetical protein
VRPYTCIRHLLLAMPLHPFLVICGIMSKVTLRSFVSIRQKGQFAGNYQHPTDTRVYLVETILSRDTTPENPYPRAFTRVGQVVETLHVTAQPPSPNFPPRHGRRGTVGAHGGTPNVRHPLALGWERRKVGEGN